jgi:hypothetical protein
MVRFSLCKVKFVFFENDLCYDSASDFELFRTICYEGEILYTGSLFKNFLYLKPNFYIVKDGMRVVKDKIDIDTYGYRYGRYGRRVGTYTTVQKYQQGTLVVDLADAKEKELVWRGWAKGEAGDSGFVQDQMS